MATLRGRSPPYHDVPLVLCMSMIDLSTMNPKKTLSRGCPLANPLEQDDQGFQFRRLQVREKLLLETLNRTIQAGKELQRLAADGDVDHAAVIGAPLPMNHSSLLEPNLSLKLSCCHRITPRPNGQKRVMSIVYTSTTWVSRGWGPDPSKPMLVTPR